ncbi:MAG: pyridoxal phosphate-dependent aminotransferase [Dehalococcoidia bacterium]
MSSELESLGYRPGRWDLSTRWTSERVGAIGPSATITLANRAKALVKKGSNVIELGGGDPDFETPPHIVQAAAEALYRGYTHYDISRGLSELREAISRKLAKENMIAADPDQEILVTPGGKQALVYALLATVNPGDQVLIPEPCWVSYAPIVSMAGGEPVFVLTDRGRGFRLDPDNLAAQVTPKTKLLILANPNNPTGVILSKEELGNIAGVVSRYGLLVVADEVYEKIVFDGKPFTSFASLGGMAAHTVTVNSFSKTYAMTGWRLGYMVGHRSIIAAVQKIHEHMATCVSSFSQWGALAALRGPQDCVEAMVKVYQERRDSALYELTALKSVSCLRPQGTFYLFMDIGGRGLASMEVAELALERAQVTVAPGLAFGPSGEGYVRLSLAVPTPRFKEGITRLCEVFSSMQVSNRH